MITLFIPLFFVLAGMATVHESLLTMTTQIRNLAQLDRQVGDKAEEICQALNSALALNTALRTMHATCEAALYTGTFPAMEAAAQLIRLEQDLLILGAQVNLQSLAPGKFSQQLAEPERRGTGNCGLPAALLCPQKEVFSLRHQPGTEPAGVKADASGMGMNCTEIRWRYSDERVRAWE